MRTDVRELVLSFDSALYGTRPTLPITFIYRKLLTQTVDVSSGVVSTTWDNKRINGYGGHIAIHDMELNKDKLEIGDQFILFDVSQIDSPPKDDDRVLLFVTYKGTVSLDNGSAVIQGLDTEFLKEGVQGGDVLIDCDITGNVVEIASVQSDTQLTLRSNWTGSDIPYAKYEIFRSHNIIDSKIDPILALTRLGLRRAGS
jgi:hypothetical protein